ncbi:MAG: DegT/DnrJ/EryC1/StrS family aminotransferase [Deltaproteobacteria bacterium]|nr:DegT/DnrJ/EryC1/StrS family aminotransferase [Deltaproteobacteria bacterium]
MIPIIKPAVFEEEAQAAAEAVRSGWLAQGPRVAAFEAELAGAVEAPEGVALSSCTTALHLALAAHGIGPGDEVIVPSLSFIATTNAVAHCGATPVFADVEDAVPNLSAATVAPHIGARTRAVIVAHQVGFPADLGPLQALCDAHGLLLLEDAACAIGSTYQGRRIGAVAAGHPGGALVAWSFHPRKVLTTGEGGALTLADAALAARLRTLRQHAMSVNDQQRHAIAGLLLPSYPEVGWNYRMTDVQAAIGRVQLGRLDAIVARRRELAARYGEQLLAATQSAGITLPVDPPWGTTNHQSYVVRVAGGASRRDAVLDALLRGGIGARPGIMAAHQEPAWAALPRGPLPATEAWAAESIALPLFHTMQEEEQARVVASLLAALSETTVDRRRP